MIAARNPNFAVLNGLKFGDDFRDKRAFLIYLFFIIKVRIVVNNFVGGLFVIKVLVYTCKLTQMTPESHLFWKLSFFHWKLGSDFLIWHIYLLIIQISTFNGSWISFQLFAFFIITTLSFRGANFIFTLRNFIALGISGQWSSLHQTSTLALSFGSLLFGLVRVLICTRQGDSRFHTFFIL